MWLFYSRQYVREEADHMKRVQPASEPNSGLLFGTLWIKAIGNVCSHDGDCPGATCASGLPPISSAACRPRTDKPLGRIVCRSEPDCLVRWSEPSATAPRLIAVPHVGAGAAAFRSWAELMPEISVYGVRFPGRESRFHEVGHRAMLDVVDELVGALSQDLGAGPLILFGQCSGALIAFEVARELRNRSLPLATELIVAGQVAPRQVPNAITRPGPGTTLEDSLRDLGGIPDAIWKDRELLEMILVAAEADFEVLATYRYEAQAPLETPVTVFIASEESVTHDDAIDWRRETTGKFAVMPVEGDHFSSSSKIAATIAQQLGERGH